jgi:hypothetical protein
MNKASYSLKGRADIIELAGAVAIMAACGRANTMPRTRLLSDEHLHTRPCGGWLDSGKPAGTGEILSSNTGVPVHHRCLGM